MKYDQCLSCGKKKRTISTLCRVCRFGVPRITQPDDTAIRHIPLTRGYFAVVSVEDYERVTQHKWSATSGKRNGKPTTIYAVYNLRIGSRKTTLYLHRFILGITDPSVEVDHKDNDGLNCRRTNIRAATSAQNQANKPIQKNNTIGFKGIQCERRCSKLRWLAKIQFQGETIYIGTFDTAEEAAHAYDRKAIELFGEFAYTNFPRETYLSKGAVHA